jgi:hypothetical protein
MSRGSLITLVLAVLVAAPVVGFTSWSLYHTAEALSDPCTIWGAKDLSAAIGPHDQCRTLTVNPRSRASEALVAALVPGGLLVFSVLGVAGTALKRRRLLMTAAAGTLAETFVVLTIAPLTLLAGVAFLLIALRARNSDGRLAPHVS